MGLRTASVRRPRLDVMAPALTDAARAQAPTFDLPPKSPTNGFQTKPQFVESTCSAPQQSPVSPLNTDDDLSAIVPFDASKLQEYMQGGGGVASATSAPFGLRSNMSLSSSSSSSSSMGDPNDRTNMGKTRRNHPSPPLHLEPNVEDIMQQVMKSIEATNSDNLTEVLENINIDKDLLINIGMDDEEGDRQDRLETEQKMKEDRADALLLDLHRRQAKLERRLDVLRRRCGKMQSKLMGQHVSDETVGVFEHVQRTLKRSKEVLPAPSVYDPAEKLKPLSANAAKLLAKKLEMAKVLQANTCARQKSVPKYFGSGSIETAMFRTSTAGQVNIPQWAAEEKLEVKRVAEQLGTQLRLVQEEYDSEATESSSGGESCDELQSYNNPHQQYLSIQKRALWKYSTDRAAIAARWTWVQSQISDLEYRIRQHSELHKQIRTSKGPVQLGDVAIRLQPIQSQSEIAGHHDYGANPIESTNSSTTVNGYLGQLPGAVGGKTTDNDDCCCARTRPLVNFRKRRLVQVGGLHVASKKAARPSTIRCNCVPTQMPCALCTGRTDPTHPRDTPDTLGRAEKVALLDSGYHPVLSLPEDTSQTLHLEAIMKMPEWQQRSLKMKTMKVLHKADRAETRPYEHRAKKLEHRKKYNRLKPSTVSALTEKIKKKLRGRKVGRPSKFKKRQSLTQFHNADSAAQSEDAEVEATIGTSSQTLGSGSQARLASSFDSPGGSPLLHMQLISGYKQSNRVSRADSYDIDNIVIPYSVAAATRVEKLQYKEILTPKWRIAEDGVSIIKMEVKNNGSVADLLDDNDVEEDMSEEAVVARHDRCEYEEKKRFLSYMKFPLGHGRQRSHKRQDSMATDTSRANTPDPASPYPDGAKSGGGGSSGGGAGGGGSQSMDSTMVLSSPPPTPGTAVEEPLPSIALMRRRTVSQSRFRETKDDVTPIDYVEQPPYEPRLFPLSDADYQHLVQEMPEAHREVKTNYRAQDTGDETPVKAEQPDSGDSESTESAIGEDLLMDDDDDNLMEDEEEEEEDPNDPEWTDAEKSTHKERHHRR